MITRRRFIHTLGAGAIAASSTAKSYAQILGSNSRLNFAVIGLNSRAYAHLSALKANKANARISHVCDVESNILKKYVSSTTQMMGEEPVGEKDFRNILAMKEIDAITMRHPIIGTRLWQSLHCRRERMCMSKNPALTILLKVRC